MKFKLKENIYAGNNTNNKINKRKHKKSWPPFLKLNAGNVEKNVEIFNHAMGTDAPASGEGAAVGENLDESKTPTYTYKYIGPVYRFEDVYTTLKTPVFTDAKSVEQAANMIKGKLKKKFGFSYDANLDIDEDRVELVDSDPNYFDVIDDEQSISHNDEDYIMTINGKDVYFEDGYYVVDDKKFVSEEEIRDYLEEDFMDNFDTNIEYSLFSDLDDDTDINSLQMRESLNEGLNENKTLSKKDIVEILNKIDNKCINEDTKFYDLKTQFNSLVEVFSEQDRKDIKDVVDATRNMPNDKAAETISAVLAAKERKNKPGANAVTLKEEDNGGYDIDDYFTKDELLEFFGGILDDFCTWSNHYNIYIENLYFDNLGKNLCLEVYDDDSEIHPLYYIAIEIDKNNPTLLYKKRDEILKKIQQQFLKNNNLEVIAKEDEFDSYEGDLFEALVESLDHVKADLESIEKFLRDNNFTNYDVYDYNDCPLETSMIAFEISGDWKHDHLYFKNLIKDWAKQNNRRIWKIDSEEVGNSDSDYYTAIHRVYITNNEDSFRKLNSMTGLFGGESTAFEDEFDSYEGEIEERLNESSDPYEEYLVNISKFVENVTKGYTLKSGAFVPEKFSATYLNDLFDEFYNNYYKVGSHVIDHSKDEGDLSNYNYWFEKEDDYYLEDEDDKDSEMIANENDFDSYDGDIEEKLNESYDFEDKYIGRKVIFSLQSTYPEDWGFDLKDKFDAKEWKKIIKHNEKEATVTALGCFSNPSAVGTSDEFTDQYWDIKFEDGVVLTSVSGVELELEDIPYTIANENEFDEFEGEIEEKLTEGIPTSELPRKGWKKIETIVGTVEPGEDRVSCPGIMKKYGYYQDEVIWEHEDSILPKEGTKVYMSVYELPPSDPWYEWTSPYPYFILYDEPVPDSVANEDDFDEFDGEIEEMLLEKHSKFKNGEVKLVENSSSRYDKLEEEYKHLNDKQKLVYIDTIENECDDIEELKDIVHEIFFYDKGLYSQLRFFPKDASFEQLKENKLAILRDSLHIYNNKEVIADENDFGTYEGNIEERLNESNSNNQPIPVSLELLSVEEAKKIPKDILNIGLWWWLKTPGSCRDLTAAAAVLGTGDVYEYGFYVNLVCGVVRPVLTVSNINSSDYELYKTYDLFGDEWIYIGTDRFLYSIITTNSRLFHLFDKYSNDYEKSEIKRHLEDKLRDLAKYVDYEIVADEDEFDSYEGDLFESLYRKNTSTALKNKILDCLDWFITMEMEFPKDKFLADSWEDLKDGILMGIDDEVETAEGVVEYFKPIISFNRHYNSEEGEEGVFADEIELYKELVRSLQDYLAKEGYDYDPDPPDTIANETEFSEYDGEIDESVKEDFSEDEIEKMIQDNKDIFKKSLDELECPKKKHNPFKFKIRKDD